MLAKEVTVPRKTTIRYWKSRNGYWCQFNNKQEHLASGPDDYPDGPTYAAARNAFNSLMAFGAVERAGDDNTVYVVLERYMDSVKKKWTEQTYEVRVFQLQPFITRYGNTKIAELTHALIDKFLDEQRVPRRSGKNTRSWGDTGCSNFLMTLKAALRWAQRRKDISSNPMDGYSIPTIRSRSRDCLVSPETHRRLLGSIRKHWLKRVVIALENTGARPGELLNAKGTDWDDELGAIVYYRDDVRREDDFRHKTAKYKDRVICFDGEALEMVRSLVKANPTGYIFARKDGRRPHRKTLVGAFRAHREKLGVRKLTAYSYRHTFATNWLKAGKPVEILAELLGNSPQTIYKHYQHLCADRDAIRKHLQAFRLAAKSGDREGPERTTVSPADGLPAPAEMTG
jgi:integrase